MKCVCVLIVRIEHIVFFNVNSASAIPIAVDFEAQRSIVIADVIIIIRMSFFFLFRVISKYKIYTDRCSWLVSMMQRGKYGCMCIVMLDY